MTKRQPVFYISHGGGPWPWMPELRAVFKNLEASLVDLVASLEEKPRAILMISGHWEADTVKVQTAANPGMEYDYFGFPPHTYEVKYASPGAPDFAERTLSLLKQSGIKAEGDPSYGYDHGVFTPMEVMYPDADMPLYQVSMLKTYDPTAHMKLGQALKPLRDEGVLIIGSGLSYHNLRAFGPAAKVPSAAFDGWLFETLSQNHEARCEAMLSWESAPHSRSCHPREDHLVPLFVSLGACEDETATRIYHETDLMGGISVSSYRFGS